MRRSLSLFSACLWLSLALAACSGGSGGTSSTTGGGATGTTGGASTGSTTGGSTGATTSGAATTGASSTTRSTPSSSGGRSGGLSAGQLLPQVMQIDCDELPKCAPEAAYLQASCPTFVERLLGPLVLELDAGVVAYDAAAAPECLSESLDAGCGLFNGTVPGCAGVFTGTVAPGGACYSDRDCLHGSCTGAGTCPRTCVAYAQLGQDCSMRGCDSALTCVSVDDGGVSQTVCLPSTPVPDAGLGGSCATGAACAPGTYCGAGYTTCVAQLPDGGACTGAFGECAGLTACVGALVSGGTVAPSACLPLADVGGVCLTSSLVSSNGCLSGLACQAGPDGGYGSCVVPPSSGACLEHQCEQISHTCDQTTQTCVPIGAVGATCDPANYGADCTSYSCTADMLTDGGTCAAACVP